MLGSFAVFKFACKAALHCAGFGVAGDLVGEVVPDVARSLYLWWVKDRPPAEVHAELSAVAALNDDEAKALALRAVAEEGGGLRPKDLRLSLVSYLSQLPAAVRQTQRRPADPTGRTVAANLTLRCPADVMALLPTRLPRFHRGQQAPGFADWKLDELLGVGGFGEVWRASNPHLPPVALKICLAPAAARFLRNEADLLGRVVSQGKHPGIVALLNTALSGDPPCLMYEYVPGGDLGGLVQQWRESGSDRVERSLAVMRRLADVIAFAHGLTPPIVHRDLKPANILLQEGFSQRRKDAKQEDISSPAFAPLRLCENLSFDLKVADFGIGGIAAAQAVGMLGPSSAGRSVPTALRGSCTPLYASPQQLRGEEPDPRDDVFSLGVIWYQLLAGDLSERPGADWREELGDVPAKVLDVLARCLAARAERRFADAGALAAELARLEAATPVKATFQHEEEEEPESDDPADLAGHLQRSLVRVQKTLACAMDFSERRHDYAMAVRLLEGLPEPFRDNAFLEKVRERRDRVNELRMEIRHSSKAMRFAGLRDRIEELLELTPEDDEARGLLEVVPWEPGREVVNSVGMRLVLIPAGSFKMGSPGGEVGRGGDEGPPRAVTISRRFYLGMFPVTQEQYQRVTGTNPSHFRTVAGQDTRAFPVECVSWQDAAAFCRALSDMNEERRDGRTYRLPTEAEWEYACRAGTADPFSFGRSLSSAQANFDGRHPYGAGGPGDFLQRPSPVGSYPPNAWGLCDMHGNVWEWCADWYAEDYYRCGPPDDPPGPEAGEGRVLRGGSWQNHGRLCRSACRDRAGPSYRSLNAGFRVVLEVRKE